MDPAMLRLASGSQQLFGCDSSLSCSVSGEDEQLTASTPNVNRAVHRVAEIRDDKAHLSYEAESPVRDSQDHFFHPS